MKVLVATKETQGRRKNDFSWTDEGEFVGFSFECDGERVDGRCGCRRAFSGLHSHKATTTARVVEKEMTVEQYLGIYHKSLISAGWIEEGNPLPLESKGEAMELLRLAATFPTGMVVEKRGDTLQTRVL